MRLIPEPSPDKFAFGLEMELRAAEMDKLWEYISRAKEKPKIHNTHLAGNISSSLTLDDTDNWFFDNTCKRAIKEHKKTFSENLGFHSQSIFKNNVLYTMGNLWVNFQKQHEFNPLHNHTGVYSFVIFMKIPTDWREQHEIPFVKESTRPSASDFEFVYTDCMGNIRSYSYFLDSSVEGSMLFFPAEMNHQVYPFYNCEEERITISGNIVYDI